ncbi:MAG: ferrochelatase [Ardenticatenaceae bacterium]|nr:ferrochelatase [Ardenticatenaceae bacterium]
MNYPIGVLIMAYGGPNNLDEVPGYLADIRSGRVTTTAVLEEITNNYRQIGGKSPLLEFTLAQVEAIKSQLDPARFRVYLGMRHWAPWLEDAVRDMLDDGITQAVSMVLAPHFSKMSITKYQDKIAEALEMYRGQIEFAHINSYHDVPGLIEPLADRVVDGLNRWPEEEREDVHVIFSAHSLPERIIKMGDPYDRQLRETARLIAEKVGLADEQWSWSYQSAGRSPEPWLGPQIEDHIPALAEQGIKKMVSIPVGFVCDHVEILFDIDLKAQAEAKRCEVRLERPSALNTDPVFMKQLAELIVRRAGEAGWG